MVHRLKKNLSFLFSFFPPCHFLHFLRPRKNEKFGKEDKQNNNKHGIWGTFALLKYTSYPISYRFIKSCTAAEDILFQNVLMLALFIFFWTFCVALEEAQNTRWHTSIKKIYDEENSETIMKPKIFLLGVQKGGSDSLYEFLLLHPDICTPYIHDGSFLSIYWFVVDYTWC